MYLYIIQSQSTNRYYIGVSENVENRLNQHNSGNTRSTRNKGPWKLNFAQKFANKKEAMAEERKLKKWKSRTILEKIIRDGKINGA